MAMTGEQEPAEKVPERPRARAKNEAALFTGSRSCGMPNCGRRALCRLSC